MQMTKIGIHYCKQLGKGEWNNLQDPRGKQSRKKKKNKKPQKNRIKQNKTDIHDRQSFTRLHIHSVPIITKVRE